MSAAARADYYASLARAQTAPGATVRQLEARAELWRDVATAYARLRPSDRNHAALAVWRLEAAR